MLPMPHRDDHRRLTRDRRVEVGGLALEAIGALNELEIMREQEAKRLLHELAPRQPFEHRPLRPACG